MTLLLRENRLNAICTVLPNESAPLLKIQVNPSEKKLNINFILLRDFMLQNANLIMMLRGFYKGRLF